MLRAGRLFPRRPIALERGAAGGRQPPAARHRLALRAEMSAAAAQLDAAHRRAADAARLAVAPVDVQDLLEPARSPSGLTKLSIDEPSWSMPSRRVSTSAVVQACDLAGTETACATQRVQTERNSASSA